MEQWPVFDKTRCTQSACTHRPQIWGGHRCHQSSTTAHRWSFYSELWSSTQPRLHQSVNSKHAVPVGSTYLCNVLLAWCHGDCTLHTGHKGSPLGLGSSHKAVSMVTSEKGGSSCSGFSSPCVVPCPYRWEGTSPCSESSFVDLRPEVETLRMRKFHEEQFLQDRLHASTCLKRFRCSMRMSGRVHRLSLMLPCWSCLQCGQRQASSGASWSHRWQKGREADVSTQQETHQRPWANASMRWVDLFLFGVQLKALGQWAGLRLLVPLLHLTHTFSIRDVFILRPFEQTVSGRVKQSLHTRRHTSTNVV